MSKLTISGILFSAAVCAACSEDTPSPAVTTTDPFIGTWSCTDQLAITFTSPAGAPMQNVTQMSIMVISSSGTSLIAIKEKESGSGSGCSVSFTSNGATGTLNPGQTCTTEQGVTLTYTSGSATVNGSTFSSTFDFEGSGTLTIDGGTMIAATVTGTQTTSCSRLSAPPTGGSGNGGPTTTGGW